ncbi:short-chain dehydrogenase [Microbacterium sp. Root61]|uniref:SDR family NAD(P)-dependent oxidoreductase n=1 Tax=Microbacterium sp. Root61 TaxID=1736570 RepID=UPI0006FB13CC|nr:SDR family NAD(P)-dependent oxidoreductase [Microbacterium sp. Root61]KRA24667.1 short-chain dehydrogenase [Microbacterium sp. Root61]
MSESFLPLTDRTALVTGAGRGIGRSIAVSLAAAGATVVVMARTADQLDVTVAEIEAAGGRAIAAPCDIRDPADVGRAVAAALEVVPGVDILVNNAGNNVKAPVVPLPVAPGTAIGQPGSRPSDLALSDEEWDSVLDTHVRGSIALIRLLVPGMFDRGRGRVINIGSSSVMRASNLTTPYKVAKGAITHLTQSLAKEWAAYGVTVNAIAPGHFRTDMTKALHDSPEGQAWLKERIPMQRTGDTRELGALAVFLAGDLASFITGQVIYVDGGETL